ncbi:ATP-binding cassette domain-containing protein [Desulfobotulus sp. H1]|uniref:ATP-binding cassette domain-containing protein n=1 Tax=Desulfobotulus pelophilus TaxID=2823377 RepID=A0ABT3N7T7_9BACT|nr:ATP-binding cassette domain-containing protein [Desulfobotulus pelophilus]MCW7753520.1 ATP-binding cassette domain-containing protein [Desulfobotulus pelophilus]
MTGLVVTNVGKKLGGSPVLSGINLEIASGELVVCVGPSGSGKSTLLRIIAGLEIPDTGAIWMGGRDVTKRSPEKRNVAMVFQSYALYPHLSVEENMAFPLRAKGIPSAERKQMIAETASMLGLRELLKRKPAALSGGQRQRVAMGRCLVRNPCLFLMDEPLSNLDAFLRMQVRMEIKSLQRRLGTTMVYVTHDQSEAMTIADRIAVMETGQIIQLASPQDLYRSPVNRFVAGFIGTPAMNFFPGMRDTNGSVHLENGARIDLSKERQRVLNGAKNLTVGVRPEHLCPAEDGPAKASAMAADVRLLEPLGGDVLVHGDIAGNPVRFRTSGRRVREGETLHIHAREENLFFFDEKTGRCLSPARMSSAA